MLQTGVRSGMLYFISSIQDSNFVCCLVGDFNNFQSCCCFLFKYLLVVEISLGVIMASPDPEVILNVQDPEVDDDRPNDLEEYFDADHERRGGGDWQPRRGAARGLNLKPEAFTGGDDWQEYISHFEVCAELGRWNDHERVLALAACLRGPARTFYISLPIESRQPYAVLVDKLEQRFGSSRQQNRWLSRFESRRRTSNESIAALADDLRQMSQKAYPNLDALAQEALSINQLYKSITLEMKCRCIDKDCQTIADAVEVIERYEAVLGEGEKRKQAVRAIGDDKDVKRSNSGGSADTIQPELTDTLKQILTRLERLESGQTPKFGGRQNQNNRHCFICRAPDHFMRECPMFQQKPEARNRPYGGNGKQHGSNNQGNFKPSTY